MTAPAGAVTATATRPVSAMVAHAFGRALARARPGRPARTAAPPDGRRSATASSRSSTMALMRSTSSRPLRSASRSSSGLLRPPRHRPFAAQRHLEVGLHDGERRAQLVRGVGDEALLGAVELADGPQRAPRIPAAPARRRPRRWRRRAATSCQRTRPIDREASSLLDLGLAAAGAALGHAGDVGLDGQVHEHARDDHEQHDEGREQHARARVVARAKTSGRRPAVTSASGSQRGSRRRARS